MTFDFENNPAFTAKSIEGVPKAEWLLMRKDGLGGSDLALMMGHSSYGDIATLYLDKTNKTAADSEETPIQRWGHILEKAIREEFSRLYELPVIESNYMLFSRENPWMLADLDGVVYYKGEWGAWEAKSTILVDEWGPDGGGKQDIPKRVYCQVVHYMAVTGLKFAIVVVLFKFSMDMRCYYIRREEGVIDNAISIERDLWFNHVLKGEYPPPPSSSSCNKLWPHDYGGTCVASEEIIAKFDKMNRLKIAIDRLKGKSDLLERGIKEFMGDNQRIVDGGGRSATWKTQEKGGIDSKRLKLEKPEIYKAYQKDKKENRVFRPEKWR